MARRATTRLKAVRATPGREADDAEATRLLTELGLTVNEARVYLALLRFESQTAAEAATSASVPRPKVSDEGHLSQMLLATQSGAILMPPVPAFFHHPKTIEDIVDQTVGRALDQLGIAASAVQRWAGAALRDQADRMS